MSRAALQAVNTNSQTVAEGGSINVGTIKLRFGRDLGINNGSVIVKTCGYYSVIFNVTVQPTEIGEVSVALQHNGVDIPGVVSYGYATEVGQNVTLTIPTLIRVVCDNGCPCESIPDTITAVLTSGSGTVTSVVAEVTRQ